MSEVGKIVALLKTDAIEKQIAAAIVLGELKAKGPEVAEGLADVLGGKDAFSALVKGLASSDAEAAKAAALAVREHIKNADGNKRRSYLAEIENFLDVQKKKGGSPGATAAAVKILGYLEDEKTV